MSGRVGVKLALNRSADTAVVTGMLWPVELSVRYTPYAFALGVKLIALTGSLKTTCGMTLVPTPVAPFGGSTKTGVGPLVTGPVPVVKL